MFGPCHYHCRINHQNVHPLTYNPVSALLQFHLCTLRPQTELPPHRWRIRSSYHLPPHWNVLSTLNIECCPAFRSSYPHVWVLLAKTEQHCQCWYGNWCHVSEKEWTEPKQTHLVESQGQWRKLLNCLSSQYPCILTTHFSVGHVLFQVLLSP